MATLDHRISKICRGYDGQVFEIDDKVYRISKRMLQHRDDAELEDMYLIDIKSGKIIGMHTNGTGTREVDYNDSINKALVNKLHRKKP